MSWRAGVLDGTSSPPAAFDAADPAGSAVAAVNRGNMAAGLGIVAAAVVALATAACTGPATVASRLDYPVTIRALAPEYPKRTTIRRLPDDADREGFIDTYRMSRAEHRQVFLALPGPGWWLVTPRAQPTGGYRLRIRIGGRTAHACLEPPRGPVSQAFARPAYFVALPRHVEHIDWQDECTASDASLEP